jgi:hypothetical protein
VEQPVFDVWFSEGKQAITQLFYVLDLLRFGGVEDVLIIEYRLFMDDLLILANELDERS